MYFATETQRTQSPNTQPIFNVLFNPNPESPDFATETQRTQRKTKRTENKVYFCLFKTQPIPKLRTTTNHTNNTNIKNSYIF